MALMESTECAEGTPKRLDIELLIVHPTLTPQEITAALGLKAKFMHNAGDQRNAVDGTLLSGVYPDTRWRHTRRFMVTDQWFTRYLEELVEYLEPYHHFLHYLRITGGSATLIVQWLGDGYFGDNITKETLTKLVELDLDLGMECYSVPQSATA